MNQLSLVPAAARVVVLGAGYAGVIAALRLAGKAGSSARVTLVNDRPDFVERIRLHQVATGQAATPRSLARMVRGTGIELVIGRAESVFAPARRVFVRGPEGERELRYDYLVYALGSGTPRSRIEGAAEHAHTVSTREAAEALATELAKLGAGGRVAVLGGGLTGIELATELAEARPDLAVSLVSASRVAPGLSAEGQEYVERTLTELGVEIVARAAVAEITERGVLLEGGDHRDADIVVDCTGMGASDRASNWGLACTPSGRLSIDETLRSVSDERIFGAGDGAAIASDEAAFLRMACATAMPLGAHVADNALRAIRGEPLAPFGFGFFGQCISLGRKRGVVQYVDATDRPSERITTGWLGARFKEGVCKFTTLALAIERVLPGTYTWPKKGEPIDWKVSARLPA
ncbi:MAG: FAD-dependent oxidoreductase [Polyangiaceae bacterium]|nr:FAD-dependent oxidoreductase [Polyangiaceae bacterium]